MKLLKRIPLWAWPSSSLGVARRAVPHPRRAQADLPRRRRVQRCSPIIKLPTIGPFDLSVTKAVIYLWITVAVLCVVALARRPQPQAAGPAASRRHGEPLLAGARRHRGAVMKSGAETWFPYVGGAFFFILVCNLLGLIPLPFGEHHQLSFYAATGNLNVTSRWPAHVHLHPLRGHPQEGRRRLRQELGHPAAPPVLQAVHLRHAHHQRALPPRLAVGPSLRQHARRPRHPGRVLRHGARVPELPHRRCAAGRLGALYLFEIFIAFIQAFIFAILSAVYIGGALEEEH